MEKPLSVIIPVYNEGANIGRTLESIQKKINTPHHVYLVYDFEEDDTLPAALAYQKEGANLSFIKNRGKGAVNAIITGLRKAGGEYLLVSMADLSDDYGIVDEMCFLMTNGFDLVCGSRYMKGGKQIGGPLIKKTISRFAGVSLKHVAKMPVTDITNSFKLYRKSMVEKIKIESDGGFEIGMEIAVKAHLAGFKVTEIPCTWRERQDGRSRFRILKWAPKYLRWYFLAIQERIFKHNCPST